MDLQEYNSKRKFNETPEPKGQKSLSGKLLRFVVQKHAASKLHYDFRLELDGVLKSWAVPKGPSINPKDKRLAMPVEDHPLSYRNFEGTIPEGNYGAGEVIVWDRGTYYAPGTKSKSQSEKILRKGLKEGKLNFVLEGEKLKGEFSLRKIQYRGKDAWLLIKKQDEYSSNTDITKMKNSVISNKKINEQNSVRHKSPATIKNSANTSNIIYRDDHQAQKIEPMPATLAKEPAVTKEGPSSFENNNTSGKKLILTNLKKVYWPEENITKGDLINYYKSISKYILPYLKNRPHTLLRHPNGINEKSFFQKDVKDTTPDWIKTIDIISESNNKEITYLVCTNQASLLYMVNLGCIEINPWSSRINKLDHPDYMVIDLDPLDLGFDKVIETALAVKEVLNESKAKSYCKTSGATGLHIYVPLKAKYNFEIIKYFANLIVQLVHQKLPDITSMERSPSKRRGKVYLDYLQNKIGQTLVAPYSVRPRPEATVSTPLKWEEVKSGLDPRDFTIKNTLQRINKLGDIFKGVLGTEIDIIKCINNLEAEEKLK